MGIYTLSEPNKVLTVFFAQIAQTVPWLPCGDIEHVPDNGPPLGSRGKRPASLSGAPLYDGTLPEKDADRHHENACKGKYRA